MTRRRSPLVRVLRWGCAALCMIAALIVLHGGAGSVLRGLGVWGDTRLEDLPQVESTEQLRALTVRPRALPAEAPRYRREAFGQRWFDVDGNGCDTRNDILARDLTQVTFREGTRGCVVVSGVVDDPYTGTQMLFRKGERTSDAVQIDHVVALYDAWYSGAWQWDEGQCLRFANDPDNLLAVNGDANQEKGASSADQWLPPAQGFRCEYAQRQVRVKYEWGLTVTSAERQALVNALAMCSGR